MGLDTSHDCWHGSYGSFARWRELLSEISGYGNIRKRQGFGGNIPWPDNGDPLLVLLTHSDCDGDIKWEDCEPLADRLESLMPAIEIAEGGFSLYSNAQKTQQFITGLRLAASKQEDVDFH